MAVETYLRVPEGWRSLLTGDILALEEYRGPWSQLRVVELAEDPPPTPGPVTHGEDLTIDHVGPWSLQAVNPGIEILLPLVGPGRGYWRFDAPTEFTPSTPYVYNNDINNHGGIVPDGGLTIDGYLVPAGTRVAQFYDFPDGFDFYARASDKFLFRGCRFRFSGGVSGAGLFNDNTAPVEQQVFMHHCDLGLSTKDPTIGDGILHVKFLGGANHRLLRNHHTISATFVQPNVNGVEILENWIDEYLYAFGEGGVEGIIPNPDAGHLNGISSEGLMTSVKILRNRIMAPSPDGAQGISGQTDLGERGYGTQPGQVGYGDGSEPGRKVSGTDVIALFTNVGDNHAVTPGAIEVSDNLLGGTGYVLYAGGVDSTGIKITGNKITTRWWTNGGSFGPVTAQPAWGANGNTQSDNTWADDYGAGGDGTTAPADRQYPAGNGPRAGMSFM